MQNALSFSASWRYRADVPFSWGFTMRDGNAVGTKVAPYTWPYASRQNGAYATFRWKRVFSSDWRKDYPWFPGGSIVVTSGRRQMGQRRAFDNGSNLCFCSSSLEGIIWFFLRETGKGRDGETETSDVKDSWIGASLTLGPDRLMPGPDGAWGTCPWPLQSAGPRSNHWTTGQGYT